MDEIVFYAIWAGVILVALAVLAMILFGIRSMIQGKVEPLSIVMMAVPVIILAVLGLVIGDWVVAAIWTLIIMFALAALSLLLSGIRGLFI